MLITMVQLMLLTVVAFNTGVQAMAHQKKDHCVISGTLYESSGLDANLSLSD